MNDKSVTIATFWSPAEANVAKGQLHGAGIPSVLVGEETVAMNWLFSNAIGGIKLQVLESDADRALACLDEAHSVSPEALDAEAAAAEIEHDDAEASIGSAIPTPQPWRSRFPRCASGMRTARGTAPSSA